MDFSNKPTLIMMKALKMIIAAYSEMFSVSLTSFWFNAPTPTPSYTTPLEIFPV